ncbi:MAG: hypothetical protein QOK03_1492 [Candidatus Binataceae bacterium]|jgi:uncharacterized protein with PIN domain|nr:hypothetical protein [Candidatus Binataceae bacterium]
MSNGEKDKLGEKFRDVEAARENEWAHKRDQELLEKMRHKNDAPVSVGVCPECKQPLVSNPDANIGGMVCPQKHGAWFGWDTVVKIMDRFGHAKK